MRAAPRSALGSLLFLTLAAFPVSAGTLSVGVGASVDIGTGSLDLGCADLTIAGTFSAGAVGLSQARDVGIGPTGLVNGDSATLEVAGDWDNAGSFAPGTSTVRLVDGCAVSSAVVSGDTTFQDLEIASDSAKLVSFAAGSTQTVSGSFMLQGVDGALLQLRSTSPGNAAFLVAQGASQAVFVDVMDVDASGGNPVLLGEDSIKGSNTPGFLSIVVPLLSPWAAGLVGMLLVLHGGQRLLRRRGLASA